MALRFLRLTTSSIDRLQPGEGITELGLTAERLADGDVIYIVNTRVHGEPVHRVIGKESDGVTVARAKQLLDEVRAEASEADLSETSGSTEAESRRGDGTRTSSLASDSSQENMPGPSDSDSPGPASRQSASDSQTAAGPAARRSD